MKKYEKYFRSMLCSVYVKTASSRSIPDLFGFIKENCSTNLQRLEINNCDVGNMMIRIDDREIEIIADHIKRLKTLHLSGGIVSNIQEDRLNSLQTLQIYEIGR